MNIATCSLAALVLAGLTGAANADQFDNRGTAFTEHGFAPYRSANIDRHELDLTRNADAAPARWIRDYSGLPMTARARVSTTSPVTSAPEINASSAISALILLGGALLLMRGRYDSKPKL